jgi:hypothetical protein
VTTKARNARTRRDRNTGKAVFQAGIAILVLGAGKAASRAAIGATGTWQSSGLVARRPLAPGNRGAGG